MSEKNYLRIRESVSFTFSDKNLIKVKDDFHDYSGPGIPQYATTPNGAPPNVPTSKGLQVRLAATHAGLLTRNNGFYIPDKMKKGAASFTDNYNKPVLVHHDDEHSDPVGRVIQASYVDTSSKMLDKYKVASGLVVHDRHGKQKGIITEQLIRDFCDGRMPFAMQVDTIRTLFKDALLDDPSYEGMGFIELTCNITDPAAIQKLMDGRYLTGSVGATTDKAVCSICKQDITMDGRCEHRPGQVYDDAKCFIIAGELIYDEYSFVNVPADRHSKVLELHYNGIRDNIEITNNFGRIYEVSMQFPQYDSSSKEANVMEVKDSVVTPTPELVQPEEVVVVEDKKPEVKPAEDKKPKYKNGESGEHTGDCPCTKCEEARGAAKNQQMKTDEVVKPVEDAVVPPVVEESFDSFMDRIITNKEVTEKDTDHLYDLMLVEIEEAKKDGELPAELKVEDAKLSTEKRKKLAKSTFCGPGKSFPVPDCAHVTAARRLISKYKGEGSKDAILACVSRKAKTLGCGGKKKKDAAVIPPVQDAVVIPVVDTKTMDDKPVVMAAPVTQAATAMTKMQLYKHLNEILGSAGTFDPKADNAGESAGISEEEKKTLQSILRRLGGLQGYDSFVSTLVEEGFAISPECEKTLLDEVVKDEEVICTLRDELDALKKEYDALFKDMESLQDSVVESKKTSRKTREDHLGLLLTLKDKKLADKETLVKLTDELLTAELVKVSGEVDIVKITDTLGSGLSREPTETVELPADKRVTIQDNTKAASSNQKSEQTAIQENVERLLKYGGHKAVDAYFEELRILGKLPKDNKK